MSDHPPSDHTVGVAVHTVPTLHPDAGGPSRSVTALASALARNEVPAHIITTKSSPTAPQVSPDADVRTEAAVASLGPLRWVRFGRTLRRRVRGASHGVVHDHGIWHPVHVASATVAAAAGWPLVVTPRGMLTPWALRQRRLKKKIAWHTYQHRILRQAALLHATAEDEAQDLRRLGLTQPIAIIPNGVTVPASISVAAHSDSGPRTALFLSRLHPKKGLPMLLTAWAAAQPAGWKLQLVGPSEGGHRAELERQAVAHGIRSDIEFVGPVDDEAKWSYYANADLFVLPTHSENFGIVVAEALACGVPVITTRGAPWGALETHRCGWWTAIDPGALGKALEEATGLEPRQRQAMGERGRKLVKTTYAWEAIATNMQQTYRWLTKGGACPEWVYTD